jgi:hypothetical protein
MQAWFVLYANVLHGRDGKYTYYKPSTLLYHNAKHAINIIHNLLTAYPQSYPQA